MKEKNRNECRKLIKQVSGLIDKDLPPELCAELEEHIKRCPNCQIVFNTTKKTIELYQVSTLADGYSEEARQKLFLRLKVNPPDKDK